MAISPRGVVRSTSCLALLWGFRGRRIEWRYFRFRQIQDGGSAIRGGEVAGDRLLPDRLSVSADRNWPSWPQLLIFLLHLTNAQNRCRSDERKSVGVCQVRVSHLRPNRSSNLHSQRPCYRSLEATVAHRPNYSNNYQIEGRGAGQEHHAPSYFKVSKPLDTWCSTQNSTSLKQVKFTNL